MTDIDTLPNTQFLALINPPAAFRSRLTHPGVIAPFEALADQRRATLEGAFGNHWFLRGDTGLRAAVAYVRSLDPQATVWLNARHLTARDLPPVAEARLCPHNLDLWVTRFTAPHLLRAAQPGESALRVPKLKEPRRIQELPPLASALRDAGWQFGLHPRWGSSLRRFALTECLLRGGAWLTVTGAADLSVQERALLTQLHWPELNTWADHAAVLEAVTREQDAVTDPLLAPAWTALLDLLRFTAQRGQGG